jgi:hypothetical protein
MTACELQSLMLACGMQLELAKNGGDQRPALMLPAQEWLIEQMSTETLKTVLLENGVNYNLRERSDLLARIRGMVQERMTRSMSSEQLVAMRSCSVGELEIRERGSKLDMVHLVPSSTLIVTSGEATDEMLAGTVTPLRCGSKTIEEQERCSSCEKNQTSVSVVMADCGGSARVRHTQLSGRRTPKGRYAARKSTDGEEQEETKQDRNMVQVCEVGLAEHKVSPATETYK